MYRFALRPRWIVSHLFVIALIVTMVNLGLWQWGKYQDKRADNRVVRQRLAEPAVGIGSLLRPGKGYGAAKGLKNRTVTVTGVYEADQQMLIRGRSLEQEPGSWVLTPLRRHDGSLVVVNRGWMANNGTFDSVPARYAPPGGPVTVTGLLQPTVVRQRIGPTDPPTGRLTSLARVDLARYARQLDGPVLPAWVQLRSAVPAVAPGVHSPTLLGPPKLDQGPYFSYTVQWFIFSTIAAVGYPLILRRNAREKAVERLDKSAAPGSPSRDGPTHDLSPVATPTS